jgi:superfamily II DNA or RNA helicase
MFSNNMFERFSILKLVEIIGEDKLETISGALRVLNLESYSGGEVYTKGFLSSFASKTIGQMYVNSSEGFDTLFGTLTVEEAKVVCGVAEDDVSKEDCQKKARALFKIRAKRKSMLQLMGVSFDDDDFDGGLQNLSSYEVLPKAAIPYKPLKDYQFEVYFQALDILAIDYSRFILQMPTGSGKTRTAMEVITSFLNSNPDSSVIWLAHSTELCDQAAECFLEVTPHVSLRNIVFQRYYGVHCLGSNTETKIDFLCASFQSAYALIAKSPSLLDSRLYEKRLIVVDEAHKVIAPTYRFVTQALQCAGTRVMGLTATPGRTYKEFNSDDENSELSKYFFEKIVSFNPKSKDPIEYLRDKGVLAHAKSEVLSVNNEIKLSSKELQQVSELFEIPASILEVIGKDSVRNAEILVKIKHLVVSNAARSILFFATSVEHSVMICSLLKFLDIKAAHVDGSTPRATRDSIVKQFRNQDINVLCNYEVLSTGFDAPKVDCVFLARPTASVVLYSQMIGRGLRGPVIGGTENCLIVNVKDNFINLPTIETMYKVFEGYWRL